MDFATLIKALTVIQQMYDAPVAKVFVSDDDHISILFESGAIDYFNADGTQMIET
jgi:hypothetical protein